MEPFNFSRKLLLIHDSIDEAFLNVSMPLYRLTQYEELDCAALGKHAPTGDLRWQDIPGYWIEYHYYIFPSLQPPEVQFFLPAFLRYSLDKFQERTNVVEFLVYDLARAKAGHFHAERYRLLTHTQGSCVLAFLQLVRDYYEPTYPLTEARRAIEQFWKRFLA